MEEQPEIVAGEDHTFSCGFFCIDVNSSNEDRIGAVQDDQEGEADDVATPVAEFRWVCERILVIIIGVVATLPQKGRYIQCFVERLSLNKK